MANTPPEVRSPQPVRRISLRPAEAAYSVIASDLHQGDELVNIGRITKIGRVGVFVLVRVEADEWSLVDGSAIPAARELVLHEVDRVVIA